MDDMYNMNDGGHVKNTGERQDGLNAGGSPSNLTKPRDGSAPPTTIKQSNRANEQTLINVPQCETPIN